MFRRERCYNGGNCHKFVARYSEKESSSPVTRFKSEGGHSISDLRQLIFYDEYVYDICIWCGKVINRKEN